MSADKSAVDSAKSRRRFLAESCCGLGGLALASMLANDGVAGDGVAGEVSAHSASHAKRDSLAPQAPHFSAKAKTVIFLFMAGGPSHIETFDPKPILNDLSGKPRPDSFGEAKYQFIQKDAKLLGCQRRFGKHGEAGIDVSDLFPHTAKCVDDLAIIRSCHGDMVVHSAAQNELFSGRTVPGFPSVGSWVLYGLGSESSSLPSYVVMPDPLGALEAGQPLYMHGFLPALFQPTTFRPGDRPVLNLSNPPGKSRDQQKRTLRLIQDLNRAGLERSDAELEARIDSYDLAFRMQTKAPEVLDLSTETEETLRLYGVGKQPTDDYGRRCLTARKLAERGVRFITVVSGGGPGNMQWDAHADIEENHLRKAAETDQGVAGLLTDLKRRGLLDTTLVLWGGEFGRSPEAQGGKGRDHHNLGFTMWMAGGGIRGGQVVGATDEIGLRAVDSPHHFRDIHATILHQLGLDQHKLTYPHLGRNERLTFLEGQVIEGIT
jgi:hypothetical protein